MKRKILNPLGTICFLVLVLQPAYSSMNERIQIRLDMEKQNQIVAKVFDITGKLIKDISDEPF